MSTFIIVTWIVACNSLDISSIVGLLKIWCPAQVYKIHFAQYDKELITRQLKMCEALSTTRAFHHWAPSFTFNILCLNRALVATVTTEETFEWHKCFTELSFLSGMFNIKVLQWSSWMAQTCFKMTVLYAATVRADKQLSGLKNTCTYGEKNGLDGQSCWKISR